jgi:hypothetical protein
MPKAPSPTEELDALAERIRRDDPYLIDYLLGWAGLAEPQPWGAAMSFALEVAIGYHLIRGESDATPTVLGKAIAKRLAQGTEAQRAETATEIGGSVHDGPVPEGNAP